MAAYLDNLKAGFGWNYLRKFHADLVPETRAVAEYAARPLKEAIMLAPGRMVDAVEDMLASYRRNDTAGTPVARAKSPVIIVAVARDMTATPPDWSIRQTASPTLVCLPGDPLNRILRMQTVFQEFRAQVVFISPEVATGDSLARQFHTFVTQLPNRRFFVPHAAAGTQFEVPVVIENPDIIAITNGDPEARAVNILACDLNLRALVPTITGARPGEPNDGQGDGTFDNPHGLVPMGDAVITDAALATLSESPADRPQT